ncbi:unnamed protein product [Ceutorhynchus assimilis]|uniref:SET domain-containing protein n=1 Tax=Ceutorhynchus assimilis TaxID=467358 RepID=A0A9N9QGC7_9CUCU|nr:unnamed protein product [Ceutorhynchus assimilis]
MDVDTEIQVHNEQASTSCASGQASASTSSEMKIPQAPVQFEVRQTDTSKGRCLVAVTAIPAKTVIFEEEPFVFSQFAWNKHCGYSACDHCLRPLEIVEANISRLTRNNNFMLPYPESCQTKKNQHEPCPDCLITYCSESCLKTAYQEYHKTLCPGYGDTKHDPMSVLENAWRKIHYPPETTTIFLLVRLLARIIQAPDKQEMVQKILNFSHKSVNEHEKLSHKFLGDQFKDQLIELRSMVSRVIYPDQSPEVHQFLTSEGFQSLIALIGTNAQGVATSAFSAWRRNVETLRLRKKDQEEVDELVEEIYEDMERCTGGEFLDNEGVGLYVKQSSVNHSCDPNAIVKFWNNNFRLSLVSKKNIEPGEEICISYLDECELHRSRHSRQKYLKENYLFTCLCPKCISEGDDPDVTSEEEASEDENDE